MTKHTCMMYAYISLQHNVDFVKCRHSHGLNQGALIPRTEVTLDIEIDFRKMASGNLSVAYIVTYVHAHQGLDFNDFPEAFTYVASLQVRGAGPGGMCISVCVYMCIRVYVYTCICVCEYE